MITSEGMQLGEVRCDRCGMTARISACYQPGTPHAHIKTGSTPNFRCGTYRTAQQLDAMVRAAQAQAPPAEAEVPVSPPADDSDALSEAM